MTEAMKRFGLLFLMALVVLTVAACGAETGGEKEAGEGTAEEKLTGEVLIDGSSTVFPIQEAVAEEYRAVQPDVNVTVGVSGTGGGFKKFTVGETDMSNASRHIKDKEIDIAKQNGIEYLEMPVAYDGISVVVSKNNDFIKDLTVEELNKIWTGKVTKWNEVRPEFPAEKINLYGPGTDSGTFDYWNEVIIGEGNTITPNFIASEDDNVIVKGVSEDKFGLGYLGFAYYKENADKLAAIAVAPEAGAAAVAPTEETINDGSYAPLSRPIFVYLNVKSFQEKPHVADYTYFLNENAGDLSLEVGYINLPQETYDENKSKLDALKK